MLYRKLQELKVIEAETGDEFEARVNEVLRELQKEGAEYEIQFNMSRGHCAYITAQRNGSIPENAADRHLLAGDTHRCVECPMWVHPTRGNVKNTRCEIVRGIRSANSPCCDWLYEMLDRGKIELEEV